MRILKQNESTSQGVATLEDELAKKKKAKESLAFNMKILKEKEEKIG